MKFIVCTQPISSFCGNPKIMASQYDLYIKSDKRGRNIGNVLRCFVLESYLSL